MDILSVNNIYKKYDDFELKNISFSIPENKIIGLIGENGAGKSTIINSILNLIKIDDGSINFFDGKILNNEIKENIGVIFDEINFYFKLNINQIEKISRFTYKQWKSDIFWGRIKYFKLPANKPIGEFSKGMKMKLGIAIALSHDAKLLILDEATNGLDPVIREEVLDIIKAFSIEREHGVLMSSHITSDLEKIVDDFLLIHDGKQLLYSSKDKIENDFGIFICDNNFFNSINTDDIFQYRIKDSKYEVLFKNKKEAINKYNIECNNVCIDDILLICVKGELK